MMKLDLICRTCKHAFTLEAQTTLKDKSKRCPECDSLSVRQTFASYMRNGPLLDPELAEQAGCRPFG